MQLGSAEITTGKSIKLPIVVKNFTDARGFGAYHFSIDFDPQGIRIDEVLGGDPPFDTVVSNITPGHVEIASYHAQIPGPTGDITAAKLAITALSKGNWPLAITISPEEFVNTDAVPIAAKAINGTVNVTR